MSDRQTPKEAEWLSALTTALTSISRRTQSPALFSSMAKKAGVDVRPHLLGVLFRLDGDRPLRVSEVAETMSYDRSTVSRHLAELTASGLVERTRDPVDGRAVMVRLSPAGARSVAEVRQAWFDTLADLTKGWNDRERASILRYLRRLGRDLETLDGAPRGL